jgi:hypothetical protein
MGWLVAGILASRDYSLHGVAISVALGGEAYHLAQQIAVGALLKSRRRFIISLAISGQMRSICRVVSFG